MSEKAVDTDIEVVVECPLCMESLDLDDLGFYPCSCGYQICRFCWHRLSNLEDNPEFGKGSRGLCPACRKEYEDSPFSFNPGITIEAMSEQNKNKKKKKKQNKQKQKQMEDKQKLKEILKKQEKNLSGLRVVQKNLVFVIGLPSRLTQEDLRREFSKYGKIHKIVVGNSNSNVNTAYITYTRPEDAVKAIQSLNNHNNHNGGNQCILNGHRDGKSSGKNNSFTLRASLGTTKYCTHWLRNQQCPKLPDCMYLHELAESEASFTKEEMQKGKHTEYEKKLIHQYLNSIKCKKNNDKRKDSQIESTEDLKNDDPFCNSSPAKSSLQTHIDAPMSRTRGKLHFNTIDEIIGSSSDSMSTSYSTCSSGSSSCPPSMSSPNRDVIDVHKSASDDMPHSPGVSMEDDGLDFDPISISTTELQDLIRSSSDESCSSLTGSVGFNQNQKHYLPTSEVENVWRNSLKALLPNVNITFANSPNNNSSRGPQSLPAFKQPQNNAVSSIGSLLPNMMPRQVGCNQYWFQQQQHRQQLNTQNNDIHRLFSSSPVNHQQTNEISAGVGFMSSSVMCQPPPGFANF
ncbi:CCR4-NOT transcription complex subunit 4-like isoform X5 [Dinothrombium tinctorium]|uniref:CCR4-NOT transcription complex subunit 4-like isoform X5 n=1 Tax=Dinothrombium tinctorium TaxID=1965070 RepID=A0A443R9V5_9ACAR|nr:CCR4-NOT transcription complex subunit 4-like isoform X5 [Dinothrombium tinctorium]RWS11656.1 CCR4-NOT transcription complex subunit 4-like isoform X5 [Dinothrombium tinctorium]RWS12049.1 CCR4-NOT transcription complex subunit 4-like isoform X5 [Dinothrombium tinctorium]RWS12937.1 CCR4-NOT transcription complex subunit 4-like isoform X5 [Dinothrombium tinctorium]